MKPRPLSSSALALSMVLLSEASAQAPQGGALVLEVSNFRSDNGAVFCTLYDRAEGYPTRPERAVARARSAIQGRRAACAFEGLAAGTYAAALFHDENNNGRLDTGIFGIPTEPVLASNNARGFMGPPSFNAARFQYPGGAFTHRVHF